MRNFFRGFYLVISVIVLASCGGGGGSSTPEPPPTPPPTPPTSTPPDCALSAQNTYYCTMTRKGLSRELYIYIPDSYSENGDPVPLLFSLHFFRSW